MLLLAGCAAEPAKPPPAQPKPAPLPIRPAPPPPSLPAPAPTAVEWQDLPLSTGDWSFNQQLVQASFGAGEPGFIVRCDPRARQVLLLRPGVSTGNTMIVRTSETRRVLPLSITPDASATPYAGLNLDDPLLDGLAFSRGRFSVEVPGMPMLVIPSWPEPARVVEDCRR